MARLQREDFDPGAEIRAMLERNRGAGAVVTFLGAVRDFSRGQEVEKLEFEAYPAMAQEKLAELERHAMEKFEISGCLIVHRTGALAVNENIVLIVVAAAHRGPAFRACEWAIDELKKRVPIWKKEFGVSGQYWVEEHP